MTMKDLTNEYLGQYRLIKVVGRGSTSTVYKAHQPSLNRYVAIKVLLRNLDPQFESRFRREAQAIAQLQHPNILPIYDYGQDEGLHYFVLQYIDDGSTLNDLIDDQPIEPVRALGLMGHLLDALDYAHRQGIIHRDIKPSNVLLPRPTWPMLADFGIAKLIDDSQHLTPAGQTVGTAAYMAPERADSAAAEVDARADIYSAGVVLYELVTGHVPFDATTPLAVLMKHVHEPLPPPRDLNPDLPAVVEQVLFRALEKDPAVRYQTAAEMAQEVKRAILEIERSEILKELMVGAGEPPAAPASRYTTLKLPPVREPPMIGASPVHDRPTLSRSPATTTPRRSARQPRAPGRVAAVVLVVALSAALLVMLGLGGLSGLAARATRPTESAPAAVVAPSETATATAPATAASAQPTLIPTQPTLLPAPTLTPVQPTTIPEPTAAPPVEPTPAPVPPVASDDAITILLEDSAWQGGYRSRSGPVRRPQRHLDLRRSDRVQHHERDV